MERMTHIPRIMIGLLPLLVIALAAEANAGPHSEEIAAALKEAAAANRIPSVLLEGLAWRESRWQPCVAQNRPVQSDPTHIGLLGVPSEGRTDAARLGTDWRYNIQEGAKALALAWERAPLVGVTGSIDSKRDVLECWYFALGRYGRSGRGKAAANAYAESVLDAVASGGEGRWQGVAVSRPTPEALAWGVNLLCPPVPWHFGDVAIRPATPVVVSLPMPYLNQIYDSPDGFDGEGACGPAALLMVLACLQKVSPRPVPVPGWYGKASDFGAYLPEVYGHICQPGLGAVHARMLNYLRPNFPGVAIVYDGKATWQRVKAELDAGRPCLIGTKVTQNGHIMAVRGYLADGRLLVGDPGGNREKAARSPAAGPLGGWSRTGVRYWNGDGGDAVYDWDSLQVRWVMTFGPIAPPDADNPEDAGR